MLTGKSLTNPWYIKKAENAMKLTPLPIFLQIMQRNPSKNEVIVVPQCHFSGLPISNKKGTALSYLKFGKLLK